MFKDVLNYAGQFTYFAELGLIIFVVVFVGVTVRTLTRSRQDVSRWASLPLDDSPAPRNA